MRLRPELGPVPRWRNIQPPQTHIAGLRWAASLQEWESRVERAGRGWEKKGEEREGLDFAPLQKFVQAPSWRPEESEISALRFG